MRTYCLHQVALHVTARRDCMLGCLFTSSTYRIVQACVRASADVLTQGAGWVEVCMQSVHTVHIIRIVAPAFGRSWSWSANFVPC